MAIAGAVLLGAAAKAPPRDSFWAERPSQAELTAALPNALRQDPTVETGIRCIARADGGLDACRLFMERPRGAGLGQALLALAPRYRVNMSAPKAPAPGDEVIVWNTTTIRYDKNADWRRKPTADDLMSVWPKDAWSEGRGGKATIDCLVSMQGALFDCSTVSEEPAGSHFGEAALALTPQLLMSPAVIGGRPVVSPVMIPFTFKMPRGAGPQFIGMTGAVALAAAAWVHAPSYADVVAAYPAKAREAKLGGRATLDCEIDRQGRLSSCNVLTEEPRREGFADAARVLSKQFRAEPGGRGGRVTHLQLPVVFDPAMLESGQPVIGKSEWAGTPTAEETMAAFGKLAVSGTTRVRLACTVQQGGSVSDCRIVSEDPAGQGVGAAALTLAQHFRLTTWTAEGLPTVGGVIHIPLRYEPGPPEPPEPPKADAAKPEPSKPAPPKPAPKG